MKVGGEYKSLCESYCESNEGQNQLVSNCSDVGWARSWAMNEARYKWWWVAGCIHIKWSMMFQALLLNKLQINAFTAMPLELQLLFETNRRQQTKHHQQLLYSLTLSSSDMLQLQFLCIWMTSVEESHFYAHRGNSQSQHCYVLNLNLSGDGIGSDWVT